MEEMLPNLPILVMFLFLNLFFVSWESAKLAPETQLHYNKNVKCHIKTNMIIQRV